MEYDADFARSFMKRTLEIVQDYSGTYDATVLVNCLLGLLIVPKEALLTKIPEAPFSSLAEWGINPSSIKSAGRCEYGYEHSPNLRQLVRRMRNAVAHFRIDPLSADGRVSGYRLQDKNGFDAEVSVEELEAFVTNLAKHLENEA